MTKTSRNAKQSDLDEGGLAVHLSFDPNGSPADGKTPNTAVPKVSLGPDLESNYGVKLTINGGSAVFTDPDPNTDGKQATVTTGGMGRGYANFTDTVAENTQTMTATVVKDPEGQAILNGPSDTEPFTFTQVADVYGLTFADALANNQPADGTSEDAGRAVVTKNGQPLGTGDSVIVVFTSSSSSTSFDLTKPYVQAGSTSQKLLVQTHNENGQTIADASFTDTAVETITLTGALQNDANVSGTQDFGFAPVVHNYALSFTAPPLANNQPADGQSADEGQVVVTDGGHALLNPQSVVVAFEFASGSANFVLSGDPNIIQQGSSAKRLLVQTHNENGKDIANASFTDATAEGVTLKARLRDDALTTPQTQDFSFATVDHYGLALNKLVDGQQADGSSADEGQAVVTDNGGQLAAPVIVQFTFTKGSARFVTSGDPNIQSNSTPTTLYVKTHYDAASGKDIANASFTDQTTEGVTLQATLPDHAEAGSPTQTFSFAAVDHYGLGLHKITDGQPADGSSADAGQAVVTDNGGQLAAPVIVQFTFTNSSAQFVTTGDPNIQGGSTPTTLYVQTHYDTKLGQDIADASFTDQTAEGVTLQATLPDHAEAGSPTQTFSFAAVDHYGLGLNKITDGQPADGSSADAGQAVVTDNGGQLAAPVIVQFTFTNGSAKFVLTGDANIQAGSTATSLLVKTHYDAASSQDIANASFTDQTAEGVTLQAALPDHAEAGSPTQAFSFAALSNTIYLQTDIGTYASLAPEYGTFSGGSLIVCDKTQPDDLCKFTLSGLNGGNIIANDGTYVCVAPTDDIFGVPYTIISSNWGMQYGANGFRINYEDGDSKVTIQVTGLQSLPYLARVYTSQQNGLNLLSADHVSPDSTCYFKITRLPS